MEEIDQALRVAWEHLAAGRLADAEPIYRQILQAQPDHGLALHFLGILAHRAGNTEQAIPLVRRSLELLPPASRYYANFAVVLSQGGRAAEAVDAARHGVELDNSGTRLCDFGTSA